jgi:hypothetical protein
MAQSASVVFDPTQAELDAALEREIASAYLAAVNCADPDLARAGFAAMTTLISQRSDDQVKRMEARLPQPWRS